MANEEHVALLKQGVAAWNSWRAENRDVQPDLSGANFSEANLRAANLSGANPSRGEQLGGADLEEANLPTPPSPVRFGALVHRTSYITLSSQ